MTRSRDIGSGISEIGVKCRSALSRKRFRLPIGQAIANAWLGEDPARVGGIVAQLGA